MTIILKKRASARIVLEQAVEARPATEAAEAVEARPAVVLIVRPAGQADIDLAQAAAGKHIAAIGEGRESLDRYGLGDSDPDLAKSEGLQMALRMGESILAIELGIRHVTGWEGITSDGETPAEIDPGNLALLMNARSSNGHSYAHLFLQGMMALPTLESAAKNVSTVSPAGTAGEAAITAAAVLLAQPRVPPGAE